MSKGTFATLVCLLVIELGCFLGIIGFTFMDALKGNAVGVVIGLVCAWFTCLWAAEVVKALSE